MNKTFLKEFSPSFFRVLPTIISASVIVAATYFLYLLIWESGVKYTVEDPLHYLSAGFELYKGGGLTVPFVKGHEVIKQPLATFPPLLSIVYFLEMKLGIAPINSPTVLSMFLWPVFLLLLHIITVKLTNSHRLGAFCVVLGAISWSYLLDFTNTGAEVIFLPLLLSLVLVLLNPPRLERTEIPRLLAATILLALLLITRYIALFLLPAVIVWWAGWRAKQQEFRKLAFEASIFVLAALPILAWFFMIRDLPRNPLSADYGWGWATRFPLSVRLFSFLKQGTWIALPSIRPGPVIRWIGWPGLLICLVPFLSCLYLVWRNQPKWFQILAGTPIVLLLIGYYSIFLVQPVYLMRPRYMSVALCLLQPWALSLLTRAPKRWVNTSLVGLILVNLGLVVLFITRLSPIPGWIQVWPPTFQDLADRNEAVTKSLMDGTPTWLLHRPPRLRDLENHHKDVVAFIDPFDRETPIITNAPSLFPLRPVTHLSNWLTKPQCVPRRTMIVVIIDWDLWSEGGDTDWKPGIRPASQFQKDFEVVCGGGGKNQLNRSVVYILPGRKRLRPRAIE